jgi:hypothetical protein
MRKLHEIIITVTALQPAFKDTGSNGNMQMKSLVACNSVSGTQSTGTGIRWKWRRTPVVPAQAGQARYPNLDYPT